MSTAQIGILLMAHGTPRAPEEVEAFYTRIRRGRPPSAAQLTELQDRYLAIGGVSPLAERTSAQVSGIAAALERRHPGRYLVRFGAKHTAPSIEEAASALAGTAEVQRVIGLVLAPHYSSLGTGEYLQRAGDALGDRVAFTPVGHWYDARGFPELVAARVERARVSLTPNAGPTMVLFTAHSLPQRTRDTGDPYQSQVQASAQAVAAVLARRQPLDAWQVAWQSAGRTPEPWFGPDLCDVVRMLPGDGWTSVVVCPIGFVADHLEVLYDVDVQAAAVARHVGLRFARTSSFDDDPAFIDVIADVLVAADGAGPSARP